MQICSAGSHFDPPKVRRVNHANTATRGESKGANDSLSKGFKNFYGFIDLNKRSQWVWRRIEIPWFGRIPSTIGDLLVGASLG